MVFISFAFLPIYNLFRFGQQSAWSNQKEIEATNYASDLVNFLRDRSYSELRAAFPTVGPTGVTFMNDGAIHQAFTGGNLVPPGKVGDGWSRSLTLQHFEGKNKGGFLNIVGIYKDLEDYLKNRRRVPSFLAAVTVRYVKPKAQEPSEEVKLWTIVMD